MISDSHPAVEDSEVGDLTRLITSISHTKSLEAWIEDFRSALQDFLPGSPSIIVSVNFSTNTGESEENPIIRFGMVHFDTLRAGTARQPETRRRKESRLFTRSNNETDDFSIILRFLHDAGYDFPRFAEPISHAVKDDKGQFFGQIVVLPGLREKKLRDSIADRIRNLSDILDHWVRSALVRHDILHPESKDFDDCLQRFTRMSRLSPREAEVLGLYVYGFSRHEIGEALCISPSTVSNHVQSIHAKSRTSNVGEINRRLFGIPEFDSFLLNLREKNAGDPND